MQLANHPAIVTGGASGLGAATARKLAARGAKVALFDLNTALAETVAKEIGGVASPATSRTRLPPRPPSLQRARRKAPRACW
jgi:NAD(P)-dependent dehydrogenase (short-subunit alcohol dehydrogenase family)